MRILDDSHLSARLVRIIATNASPERVQTVAAVRLIRHGGQLNAGELSGASLFVQKDVTLIANDALGAAA